MKQNQQSPYTDTFNKIWKVLDQNSQQIEKSSQEMKELRESQKQTDRQINKLEKSINKIGGRFNERWGHFVESLVEGKLLHLLKERGILVDCIFSNIQKGIKDIDGNIILRQEFDIIALNGTEMVVIEVKTVLTPTKVEDFLKTLKKVKSYFPDYKNKKLYGAVAYLKHENKASFFAEEKGLFVIKATGDSAHIINKKNFKPKTFS